MRKPMNRIDRARNTAKGLAVRFGIGLAVMAYSPNAEAVELTNGFIDLINPPQGIHRQWVQHYSYWSSPEDFGADNLMIRDTETGIDSVPVKDGGVWRIGFARYEGGNIVFGAYANNDNSNSNDYAGYEGWCQGGAYAHVFADGDTADEVMIIHDQNGDGIGTVDGGTWTLGVDDIAYWTEDIEFNGVQGDISQVDSFTYSGEDNILPHMTIDARLPRSDPSGLGDLETLANYWLSNNCSPEMNSDCEGADWDFDGDVDLQDFALMAMGWDPSYVAE